MSLITLSMQPDLNQAIRRFSALGRAVGRAETLAISTTTRQTGSEARRVIRDATGLTLKRIKRRVFATVRREQGKVWVGLNPWPAGYLTPLTPRDMNPAQQADLSGSFAREFFFKGAFVMRTQSGHLGIFRRRDRARKPVDEQTVAFEAFGASVAGVRTHLEAYAAGVLQREFVRQLERTA